MPGILSNPIGIVHARIVDPRKPQSWNVLCIAREPADLHRQNPRELPIVCELVVDSKSEVPAINRSIALSEQSDIIVKNHD